jgi:5,5'-dehydrodivanillate O-demethylase oxygenase subunit
MLTEEENERLTRVGPDTPMGDLLRRYWQPIAAVTEFSDEIQTKPIQLLGEHLVLFKDTTGSYGLISRICGHRLTDLARGYVEEAGLRCPLHGWLYDRTGQCLDQPLEPEPFCEEVKIPGYPVEEKAGLVWAYLGPEPAPLVPDWEPFSWEDGLVQIVFSELPCNWLQCQENALDPFDLTLFQQALVSGGPPPSFGPEEVGFDEFDFGFIYRRLQAGNGEDNGWQVGRSAIWPNALFTGSARSCRFEWRVPKDDTTTLSIAWFIDRVRPGRKFPAGPRLYHWEAKVKDEESGEPVTTHLINRDYTIWLNQTPIVDRSKEHLVETDRGIVMLRDRYFSQMELIRDGGEPKAMIRDPRDNRRVPLPLSGRPIAAPMTADAILDATPPPEPPPASFPYLAGQPPEVAKAYKKVMATWRPRAPRPPKGA